MTFVTQTSTSTNTFTGNDTVNRGIPHGMKTAPKAVFFSVHGFGHIIKILRDGYIEFVSSAGHYSYAVTSIDATNFYVGNAGNYGASANSNGVVYTWIAIT